MKIKRLTEDTLVAKLLGKLAGAVFHHPHLFVWPQLILLGLSVAYTVKFLEFHTNRTALVGANATYHQNFLRFRGEFQGQDDLVAVVQSDDTEKNRQFVERLGAKLERETNLFTDVFFKGDLKMLGSKALLFVPQDDLEQLQKRMLDYRPFIQRFTRTTNLESLFAMVNSQFRNAKREENAENKSMVKSLPALERIVRLARDSLLRPGTPPSPGVTALFSNSKEAEEAAYVPFANGQIYLVTAHARTEKLNNRCVERLSQLVDETRIEVPGVNVGITGEPVLEHDEMAQSERDTTLASVVSLLLCALIFIYGYQQTGRPVKATLCLIVGLGYTLAFATFAVGHLNLLTIVFVPILIGLAIDYGVHLISRYEEELRRGRTPEGALNKAMIYTGQGILTGALTTAGAFLAMALTSFRGIQEMGIICGGGLIICLIPMLTMLPALLLRGRQNVIDHDLSKVAERRARIENFWLQRPVAVVVVTAGLCALAGTQIGKVYFDYNLLNMQSEGLPAVEFEKKLIEANINDTNAANRSLLFGAVIATNLEEAVSLQQQLTNLPAVASVESIARFLAEDQSRKLPIIGAVKEGLAGIQFSAPDENPVKIPELTLTLWSTFGYLGNVIEDVQKDEPELAKQLNSLRLAIESLRKEMLNGREETQGAKLAAFQQALFRDVRETFQALQNQDNAGPLRVQDLPSVMRDRFIGRTGKYLLMVFPKADVWKRENQKIFIDQVTGIYPNLTGTPVQLYHYTELLKKSYEEAARYSLLAITILVFIHFRSPLSVAMALLPVGVGFLWLGGLMGFFNVPLNPANIMTLPLVIGIGVTNGIHILNRFAEEQTPGILGRSTGKAVLVSGLTAIAGFGSLILAQHRGIRSLGCVMSAGLATCMVAGLTFLPAILNLLVRQKPEEKGPDADNATSTPGREEPR